MLALVAMVLAQASGAAVLEARQPDCASLVGLEGNAWERVKSPELREYCDLVASASSKLSGASVMAEPALEAARKADALLPARATARALEGRALVALGQLPEAVVAFRDALARDPRVLDDPATLLAWARALARTGRGDEASKAYRTLLPRSSSLSTVDRASATAEGGLVFMSSGPAGLDDAVTSLRDAMKQGDGETVLVAALALALASDRRGAHEEARSILADRVHGDPRVWLASARARDIFSVAPNERSALLAFGLQSTRGMEARKAWQQYLADAPDSPWVAHARRCLEALRGPGALQGGAR